MTKLRCLRAMHSMTQCDVERLSGVPRWKISLAEVGKFMLTDCEVEAIAGVFCVPVEGLLKRPVLEVTDQGTPAEKLEKSEEGSDENACS